MVKFLSLRQSTEPVLISYVSWQDPCSCSSPESLTDPGSGSSSDPCKLLQCSLQYSSVGHSSSGLTFPLRSCDKSQTNTEHHLVSLLNNIHLNSNLFNPDTFYIKGNYAKNIIERFILKTTFILRNVPCKLTSQGSPNIYLPVTSMVGPC